MLLIIIDVCKNCKKDAIITKRAVVLDVTPEEDMTENNNLNENDIVKIASLIQI